ncbi:protein-disulfide isomerase [Palleronia aestuarii]|uniref:Protein-disulfide isomerase n=1 Tax=Palleronia aestuarii TaxID=568105 RepID=A0A2W7NDQ0_9RHOB|nr:DsbA family protein [Palleronia aestuarii]PZX18541.1 protein-disulfide isomerase [Palleronia aestuarii]
MLKALPVLLALAATPVAAFEIDAMTDAEREAFNGAVRDFLVENPEVLMEAMAVLEQRQAEAQSAGDAELVAANRDALVDDGYSWIGGNPDGDVTMVEFLDYRCGYCRRAHPEVTELVESDGNIRLIVKEFPILGEQSLLAAQFAMSVQRVAGEDAYESVHDALMTMRADVTEASLRALAEDEGLDAEAVMAGMDAPEIEASIAANHALGQSLGVNGTPSFVVGDRMLRGYVPLEGMREIVEDAREAG